MIEYAIVDDTVRFEQRHTLNVGGVWLGQAAKWVSSGYSNEEAQLYIKRQFAGTECPFCGRLLFEYQSVIEQRAVRICKLCVDEFHEALHAGGTLDEKPESQ